MRPVTRQRKVILQAFARLSSFFVFGLMLLRCLTIASTDERLRAHITILSTTDLHGNIYPIDYNTNKPDARGLARAARIIRKLASRIRMFSCWIQEIQF